MIDWDAIKEVDQWLDRNTSQQYKDYPLGQDWARIAKISEEVGEAVAEFILSTGQNPRKGKDPDAFKRMLEELADCALTAILTIQHFTKDAKQTERIIEYKVNFVAGRISNV